ncbi:hypothetical protein DL96DRAFT_1815858 [Flagelloscypha sp. PMI_526]|nr:hypothetical protein DL96DRAFT_1815858 [Flagelloscypha sp. PMI_526]
MAGDSWALRGNLGDLSNPAYFSLLLAVCPSVAQSRQLIPEATSSVHRFTSFVFTLTGTRILLPGLRIIQVIVLVKILMALKLLARSDLFYAISRILHISRSFNFTTLEPAASTEYKLFLTTTRFVLSSLVAMYRSIIFSTLTVLSVVQAACTSPRQRKDWNALTNTEKSSYISAVRCLHSVAPVSGISGATSKYEDFAATHIDQVSIIQGVGQFLPWDDVVLHECNTYESALRTDCGYTGAQPYWNETADAGAFTTSTLLQANDLSFGGDDDASNNNCVNTGPFANLTLSIGPGSQVTNHCLNRAVSNRASQSAGQSYIDACMAKTTFADAWPCIENNGPHGAGHGGVGAEMGNVQSSPNGKHSIPSLCPIRTNSRSPRSPLLHAPHLGRDKLWYDWQQASPSTRTDAIAGCTTRGMRTCTVNTTLTYTMSMADVTPDVTVGDFMDTQGDYLCYEYI